MKKILLLFLLSAFLTACDDNGTNNDNPYIPNYRFTIDINTNLPLYNALTYASNGVYIPDGGALGIIVFNTGSGYTAFDAACPNHAISSCSLLQINGLMAVCDCEHGAEYNLFTGLANGQPYPLKPYRVQLSGSNIRVSN